MPIYFFDVRDGSGGLFDSEGEELQDCETARAHAFRVASELMFQDEARKCFWSLNVRDERQSLFTVPFFQVAEAFRLLPPQSRMLIETMCQKRLALAEAIFASRLNIMRARTIVARSRSLPYLVSYNGTTVI